MDNNLKNILFINTGGGIGDTLACLPTINYIIKNFQSQNIYYYSPLEKFWFENKLSEFKPKNLITLKNFPNHFGFKNNHFFLSKDLIKKFNFDKFDLIVDNQTRFKNALVYKRIPHKYYVSPCLNYLMNSPLKLLKKEKQFALRVVNYFNKIQKINNNPIYKLDIPKNFYDEAKRLIPNRNFVGFSITAGNPYRKKEFNLKEIIKVANYYSKKLIPTFFVENNKFDLINILKKEVNNCFIPEEEVLDKLRKPILITALGMRTKFNISINNGVSHMLSFSNNKNYVFFNEQSEKWKPANNLSFLYDCKQRNTEIDKLTSKDIIDFIEKN